MDLENKYNLDKLMKATNIVPMLSERDQETISHVCYAGFEVDSLSCTEWEMRNASSMKLALQVSEQKSFPWPNASSIKFPLITVGALQWHSRSYPLLIPSTDVVRLRVIGDDKDGIKAARALRVGKHMSYQILEQDESWEEEMDKVLIHTPIVGCSFKKTFYDSVRQHNVSQFVPASSLVVNYYAKSLDDAQRVTHVLPMSKNDIYERTINGQYVETDLKSTQAPTATKASIARDKSQGVSPPAFDPEAPLEVLEQHTWMDLDGDGYQEPYIVTFRKDTKQLLRLEARFLPSGVKVNDKKKILTIKAIQFFTKYPFVPSPDGGFYDLGFGALLGPINESINTLINQLVDAGTMANTAGGFLSRGIKLRGGNSTFAPLEWKHVDSTGDDLKKGIFPLPVREPSQVLFQLLGLLINYGERIGMSVDILSGENPGQNTPAETTRTMAEQGMKIFNGVFKRTYRSLREEFRKLYQLNRLHCDDITRFGLSDVVMAEDYQGPEHDVVPTADPNVVSDTQRQMQATMIKQASMQTPGYNRYKVELGWLEAYKVPNIDELFPNPQGPNAVPPPPNIKLEEVKVKQSLAETKKMDAQQKGQIKAAELMQKAEKAQAEIMKMQAETIKIMKETESVDTHNQIEILKATIQTRQHEKDFALDAARLLLDIFSAETDRKEAMNGDDGGATGGSAGGAAKAIPGVGKV